jgi:tetratricopeptide (TPR) repeat protein
MIHVSGVFPARILIGLWVLSGALLSGEPAWGLPTSSPSNTSSASSLSGQELLRIGEIHDNQQHFLETLTYYQLALSRFKEKKQLRGAARAMLKIARVYERQGKIREAYRSLQEALPIFARSPDGAAHAGALLAMGRIAGHLGQRDEAGDSLSRAVALFEQVKDSRGWSEALVHLGLLQVSDGSPDAGMASLQQAYENAKSRRDVEQQLMALLSLGDARYLLDRTTEARTMYGDGLKLAEAEHHVPFEAKLRLRLAQLDSIDGQLTEGIALGKRALLLSQTVRDNVTEAVAWSLLADLYRRAERESEAEEADKRALAIYRAKELFVHGAPEVGP